MFRMILDIILDIINSRVIFPVKQVNLTELQAFWCNSFGAQPVLPRIQPENFQHGDPVRWAWNLPTSFNVSQAEVPSKDLRLSFSRSKSNEQPDNFNRYGSRYRQLFL